MALGPEEIAGYVGTFFDNQVMATLFTWLGYIAISALILAVLVVVYFSVQYKYKVRYPKLHYSPDGRSAQIIGWVKDRARLVKKKQGQVYHHILFANAKVHKFDEEHVLPGNVIYMLKIDKENNSYIPLPTVQFSNSIGDFSTIKPEAKYWAILQLKENERTYADVDAQKRILTYTMIAIVIMVAGCAFVAWIIMREVGGLVEGMEGLKPNLQAMAEAFKGTPPG